MGHAAVVELLLQHNAAQVDFQSSVSSSYVSFKRMSSLA